MRRHPSSTATSLVRVILLGMCCLAGHAHAQTAGHVVNLSGPLFSVKADGVKRVMSVGTEIAQGDTLVTEEKTYARVKFSDASEVTLKPNTQFKVENYAFNQAEPAKDNAVFSLFKGALRTVTGLVGKRGNQDAYRMTTPTATIGIRGTHYIAEYVPEDAPTTVSRVPYALPLLASASVEWQETQSDSAGGLIDLSPLQLAQASPPSPPRPGSGLTPGLYVHVIDGLIQLSNGGGSQSFSAGQFGYTPNFQQPPIVVPSNPGIQFTPPPAFNAPPPQGSSSPSGNRSNSVDCEVR